MNKIFAKLWLPVWYICRDKYFKVVKLVFSASLNLSPCSKSTMETPDQRVKSVPS